MTRRASSWSGSRACTPSGWPRAPRRPSGWCSGCSGRSAGWARCRSRRSRWPRRPCASAFPASSGWLAVTDVYAAGPARLETARDTLERARDHLLGLQQPAGWWKGDLQTNVSMDAEDILLRQFLGIRERRRTELSAAYIRSQQREDGTWGNFFGAPADLSTTVEAYAALRLAGDPQDAEHMLRARGYIL